MKQIIIHILLILCSIQLKAQINLVPNYSFEIYDTCPEGDGYLVPSCESWFTPISKMIVVPPLPYSLNNWGSSDYFNICANSLYPWVGIPDNFVGTQIPKSGMAYVGFLLIYNIPSIKNYKEYIETELIEPLQKDKLYCVEFNYSIAEFGNIQNYYPLLIGVLLTDTVVYRISGVGTNQPQNINTIPQISQQLPIGKDTINWLQVSASFIAHGGEKFLTIGNFQQDSIFDKNVYVYIDDVTLYYCGPDTTEVPTIDTLIIPNIFTPNEDGINDKFEFKNQEQWNFETQIFNRWGNLVYEDNNSKNWDGFYKGNKVSSGVYFYIIKAQAIKNGEVKVYKGTVTVVY